MSGATKRKADDQSPDISTSSKRVLRSEVKNIETLPTEILVKIFQYIPIAQWASMEGVSPCFRDTMYEAWKTVEKLEIYDDLFASTKYLGYYGGKRVEEKRVKMLFDKLSMRATKLSDVGGLSQLKITSMHFIDLKYLRRIDFSGFVNMGSDELSTFLEQSESRDRLRTLIIPDTILTDAPSSPAGTRLTKAFGNVDGSKPPLHLEELQIVKESTNGAANFFRCLRTIDATRLTSFSAIGIKLRQLHFCPFLDSATKLRRLAFDFHCLCRAPSTKVSSAMVQTQNVSVLVAIGKLKHLEDLRIGWIADDDAFCPCRNILGAVEDLFRLFARRRKLDGTRVFCKLELYGLFAVPKFVEPIAEYLPDLDYLALQIDRLDGDTLSNVLASQSKLKMLHLSTKNTMNLNNANTLNRYVKVEDILRSKSTLEVLWVDFQYGGRICGDLKLLAQCERLQKVSFEMENRDRLGTDLAMDDEALLTCVDGFGPNLTSLVMAGPLFATDERLKQFLSKTPRLEMVGLMGLTIPVGVLNDLPNSCPKLMHLEMIDCEKTTKAGVQAVLDGCPRIKFLRLENKKDTRWYPGRLKLDKYRRLVFK